MQRWKAKSAPGFLIGLLLLLIIVTSAGFLSLQLFATLALPPEQWPVNLQFYSELLIVLALWIFALFVVYRVATVLTLSYEIDRNGVYILWLGNRLVIPIEDIELVDNGDPKAKLPWPVFQGIGYYWGIGRTSDGQRLHLFSTVAPKRCLMLHTSTNSYAISPDDHDGFVQDLEQRRRLGAVKPLTPSYEYGRLLCYDFWNDSIVRWSLLLAVMLNIILIAVLAARYPDLADMVKMRFNALEKVTELRPRHHVLFLPLAAFGVIVLNAGVGLSLYRHVQIGARLLQIASVLMPILFGIAVFAIISR